MWTYQTHGGNVPCSTAYMARQEHISLGIPIGLPSAGRRHRYCDGLNGGNFSTSETFTDKRSLDNKLQVSLLKDAKPLLWRVTVWCCCDATLPHVGLYGCEGQHEMAESLMKVAISGITLTAIDLRQPLGERTLRQKSQSIERKALFQMIIDFYNRANCTRSSTSTIAMSLCMPIPNRSAMQ